MIKIISYIFFSMLICCESIFAQNVPANPLQPSQSDLVYVIDNFSAGLEGHSSPYSMSSGEATDVYNARFNDEYGAIAKRPALSNYSNCSHSAAVTGLYRFYQSNGNKYTVTGASASGENYLDYAPDSGGSCINLFSSGNSVGTRWNFATYKDILIATNGTDYPQKWDGITLTTADTTGARSAGYLTAQLGAPFAKLSSGSGLTASKWYHYVVAYYDGTNYWYSTAQSNPIQMGAATNDQIALTGIPIGPATTEKRYLYRTLADNSAALSQADTTYYLVTTFNDDTTTTYTDSSSDSTIDSGGGATPTWSTVTAAGLNVTPPHGIFPYIDGSGYFWLANDPSGVQYGQSTAYFDSQGDVDYFLSNNYFLIRPDDGDVITFFTSYLGAITVGKTNTVSKIYESTSSPSNWSISNPFSYIGCIAPYSAISTPAGIVYLGRQGIYEFNGQSSQLIADVITNDVLDINQANLGNMAAVFWKNEYRLAYASTQSGASSSNRVILYDMVRNDFVKDTENINVWAIFGSNGDFGGLYSGSSGADGNILAQSQQPTELIVKYLSDFNSGTFSNTASFGTQTQPVVSLSLPTWANWNVEWKNMGSSTWQANAQPGTWISPIYQINASALSTVQWNTSMPSGTSDTIAVRTASTSAGISSASWSSEFSNPGGSNISAVSANNYIQIRITFNTNNLGITPSVYVQNNYAIELIYSPAQSSAETTIPTTWTSGWMDLVTSPYLFYMSNFPKSIKEIDVYYEGTQGSLNVNIQNLKGDSSEEFTVSLSNPIDQISYFGPGTSEPVGSPGNYMVYVWKAPINGSGGLSGLYGDKWMLNLSESGNTAWRVERIAIRYDLQAYAPYH